MTTPQRNTTFELERGPIIVASLLVAAGALIAFIGVALGTRHAWSQGNKWVRTVDTSPAKAKFQQLQKAAAAGAAASTEAWKKADTMIDA